MVFSSLVFLFTFLPLVLIFYFLVPRAAKNPVLLAASLIFYAWGEPVYLFLMLLSIGFNYICGMEIGISLDTFRFRNLYNFIRNRLGNYFSL